MAEIKLEGTCWKCGGRVTGNGASKPWRHDKAPADKHQAHPTGTLTQI